MGNDGIAVHTHHRPAVVSAILIPRLLAYTAILLPLVWLYRGTLLGLFNQWASDDNYSHGFVVVPLAVFFVWERRQALAEAVARPSVFGLLTIALGLLLFVTGTLGAELFLTRVSLIGVLAGVVLLLYGHTHLRIVAFPLAFLLLMVPLPAIVFNQIAFPLQLAASNAGEWVIATAGVPVLRDGNILQLPSRTLEVAEACSGIRSLISLLMLSILLGYFTERRLSRRLMLAVATIPLAIVANAIRVAGTGLASEWISPAAADGFFHTFSGWLMFLVTCAVLFLIQRALPCDRRRAPAQRVAMGL
jgi:exosortase